MIKPHRLPLIICSLILVAVLVFWPGQWLRHAAANVTLVSFTANTAPGQPGIDIQWTTATEFNTVGFYVRRSDNVTGPFVRLFSMPIPSQGDELRGSEYSWPDNTTVLGQTYFYQLEEITTDQRSEFYGPITVTAGVSGPVTPTPAASLTPTVTPTASQSAHSTTSTTFSNNVVITPRVATGATTTPLHDSSGSLSSSQAPMAVPISTQPDTAIRPVASFATAMPPVVDAVTAATVAPSPLVVPNSSQPQAPVPTLAPTDAVPAEVEPIVIATDAAPTTATAGSTNTVALLLIGAAFLFLGLAFIILRRVRS